jgi:acetylornithine deacetylase/succinyl-diaminopimelate desuccinylase-like protein
MGYAPSPAWSPVEAAIEAFLAADATGRMQRYIDFLRIPSVSALPERAADCRAAAEWLAAELRRVGATRVEVSETGGHPIVVAERIEDPKLPTIVVYGHYDVQPGEPLDLWKTSPFEPTIRDGRILGRGSADDKGQIVIHLNALEALLATRGKLPVNVKYLFEGEEESSSVHLEAWMKANPERCTGDAVIISDTGFFEGNIPAITIGLRGITYLQVDLVGSYLDLHSGAFGGSIVNPANALAKMIAGLHDADGRVTGFTQVSGGSGYSADLPPLIEIEGLATAVVDAYGPNGSIARLRVTYPGDGYGQLPRVTIRPNGFG